MKLSIILPCYNEENTIEIILNKILNLKDLDLELIVIDDGSTDRSLEKIKKFKDKIAHIIINEKNMGKGYSIQLAGKKISGEIVIIQDADLEYDPNEFFMLIRPIIEKKTNVVYGSRFLNKKKNRRFYFLANYLVFGNYVLTFISNLLNSQDLTDAHTCYKVFKKKTFDKINLTENRFAFCPEITTKIALINEQILEVPINYKPRTYENGKKIGLIDAFDALKALIKYRFFKKNI